MILRLLALLGVFPLVWTEDHDGDVRLRVVRKSPFGKYVVRGISPSTYGVRSRLRDLQ